MFTTSHLYQEDIEIISSSNIDWNLLKNKSILITGATGLIGTFLIDLLMYRNNRYDNTITIYAVSRSREKITVRFKEYMDSGFFHHVEQDIQNSFNLDKHIDYIIHGASNTHPIAYATQPVNTILLSILGTKSILDFASLHNTKRTVFLSTVEIYGENRGDTDAFTEDYSGYINCNTMRAGYPEGKRAAEALCQAYINENNLDIIIARCCRVYGPTMSNDDSKVIAQFIRNAVNKEAITLKSKGGQRYSYCYAADICSAILFMLLNGKNGEAYNISNNNDNLSLLEIANFLSGYTGKEIIFNIPDATEAAGYSKATKALLDSAKLTKLGWKARFPIKDSLVKTVEIIRTQKENKIGSSHSE